MSDWVLRLTATGEQQGQDDEQQQGQDDEQRQGQDDEQQQGQDDEEQQEAREMSENVIVIDENENVNTGEAKKRKRGDGEQQEQDEEEEQSECSDFEDNLRKRASRKTKSGGGGDADDEFVEASVPKDIMQRLLPVAIKEGLTTRQVVVMTSAFLMGSGLNLDDFILSTATCWRQLTQHCGSIGDKALNQFVDKVKAEEVKVVCHFDGKILEEDFAGKRQSQHRLVSLLKSPSLKREHLLAVAALQNETGYTVALEIFGQLLQMGVDKHVAAAVFDSTSVNTGSEEGAAIHLQRLLDRPILEIECGHHVQVQNLFHRPLK